MHHRNIRVLTTQIYKVVCGLACKLVSGCLKLSNMTVYSIRRISTLFSRVLHSTESFSHLKPKISAVIVVP